MRRPSPFLLPAPLRRLAGAGLLSLLLAGAGRADETAPAVAIARSGDFFLAPGAPGKLAWHTPLAGPLKYVVRDYSGATCREGTAEAKGGEVDVEIQLPAGFYELRFSEAGGRFGLCVLPPADRGGPDPFFGIDAALSWLEPSDAKRKAYLDAMAYAGIAMARERLGWPEINPAPGAWDGETRRGYATLRKEYAASRIPVLDLLQKAPDWLGKTGVYPLDLAKAATAWDTLVPRWSSSCAAFELWNEPDNAFGGNMPADQAVPTIHTMAYALQAARAPTVRVGGALSRWNGAFVPDAIANGLLDGLDAFSFHDYGRALFLETTIGSYRDSLAGAGRPGMPLWITESGWPWKLGPGRPGTADEDAASAREIVMKAVEARACGVARYFPFVLPYYEERQSNFAMMGKDGTPLRSLEAYAACIRTLSHLDYLGDLRVEGTKRARLFGNGAEAVAVLYTGVANARARVPLPLMIRKVTGIDGRSLPPGAEGSVPIPDGLCYVFLDRNAATPLLDVETEAMRLTRLSRKPVPAPAPLSPVVLQFLPDLQALHPSPEAYFLAGTALGKCPIRIRVTNLDPSVPQQLTLSLSSHGVPAGRLGEVRKVTIPPRAFVEASWEADLRPCFREGSAADVVVEAEGESGIVARAVLRFIADVPPETALKAFSSHVSLPFRDTECWSRNIAEGGKMTITAREGEPWRLEAAFAEGADAWAYPTLALPKEFRLEGAAGLVLRARCLRPGRLHLILSEEENGKADFLEASAFLLPGDGQWHTVYVPFDRFTVPINDAARARPDLAKVRRIRIGLNKDGDEMKSNTLEVSDFNVVWQKEGPSPGSIP